MFERPWGPILKGKNLLEIVMIFVWESVMRKLGKATHVKESKLNINTIFNQKFSFRIGPMFFLVVTHHKICSSDYRHRRRLLRPDYS